MRQVIAVTITLCLHYRRAFRCIHVPHIHPLLAWRMAISALEQNALESRCNAGALDESQLALHKKRHECVQRQPAFCAS